jgi:predicted DNA-binding ribbon-helix-helix protein
MTSGPIGKSLIGKRSVFVGTRKTSVTLEAPFWEALKNIAATENISLNAIATRINEKRQHLNFSSVIRLYVLDYYVTLSKQKTPNERQS